MRTLTKQELKGVQGGWSISGIFGLGALITFIIGAIDGYIRPLACN